MLSRLGHGLYKKIDRLKNIFRCIYIISIATRVSLTYFGSIGLQIFSHALGHLHVVVPMSMMGMHYALSKHCRQAWVW